MLPEYSTNLFMAFFWLSAMSTLGLLAWSKHWVSNRKQVCLATAALAVATIGLLSYLIADHYTGVGINDAALFHVGNGMTGLQQEMWLPIAGVLLGSFLCLGLIAYVLSRAAHEKTLQPPVHRRRFRITGLVLVVLAILINPGFSQTGALFTASWLAQRNVENVMEHAQSPAPFVPSENARQVSAVYIYAEGLEAAFMDEAKFPGLMPNLNRLSKTAVQIRGIKQVPFTGWTAAGQIAGNCGFPGLEGQVLFAADGSRWPCASNLLAKDGYEMVYLNGSSLEFADKGAFWRDRGYAKAYGDREVNRLAGFPQATLSAWGAYDDMLMEASWNEYQRLNRQEKPFVLTLLTVDTHLWVWKPLRARVFRATP
jgi:phosphoglycerol transferase